MNALSQHLRWLDADPLFAIAFALGKLVRTLPSAWRGSLKGEGCPTTAGVEAVKWVCGALCKSAGDQRELGIPRPQASLSLHAGTVVVAAWSGVAEGSPGRLLCTAGGFEIVVGPRRTWRNGEVWTEDVGYVTGFEARRGSEWDYGQTRGLCCG